MMEILQNPVFIVILGLATTLITQIAKKTKAKPQIVAVLIALILGTGYYMFEYFTNTETQEFVLNSAMTILGYATVLYHVYNNFKKMK